MHTETYERDGIRYVISLYEGDDRYHAGWTCPVCNKGGGLPDLFWSAAEAIGRAKAVALTEHHVPVHELPARTSQHDAS